MSAPWAGDIALVPAPRRRKPRQELISSTFFFHFIFSHALTWTRIKPNAQAHTPTLSGRKRGRARVSEGRGEREREFCGSPSCCRMRPFLASAWNWFDTILILGTLFSLGQVSARRPRAGPAPRVFLTLCNATGGTASRTRGTVIGKCYGR
jgi:hypothetical protein